MKLTDDQELRFQIVAFQMQHPGGLGFMLKEAEQMFAWITAKPLGYQPESVSTKQPSDSEL